MNTAGKELFDAIMNDDEIRFMVMKEQNNEKRIDMVLRFAREEVIANTQFN